MQTQILDVQGMSCDACVGHVTRALKGLGGVQSAVVSLSDHEATVIYDPAVVQLSQMLDAVADEGYKAAPRA